MSSLQSSVLCLCSSSTRKCSSGLSLQKRVFCRCNEMSGICSENSSCRKRIMCLNKKNSGKNYEEIRWNCFLWWQPRKRSGLRRRTL